MLESFLSVSDSRRRKRNRAATRLIVFAEEESARRCCRRCCTFSAIASRWSASSSCSICRGGAREEEHRTRRLWTRQRSFTYPRWPCSRCSNTVRLPSRPGRLASRLEGLWSRSLCRCCCFCSVLVQLSLQPGCRHVLLCCACLPQTDNAAHGETTTTQEKQTVRS